MKNIKLIIEYDGTNYAGWQRQNNALTIQQVLEEAVTGLTGEAVDLFGSGRTDSGVHARGQTANFITNSNIPPDRYSYALNSVLPKDIRVQMSSEVDLNFNSRFSAIGKKYRYSMIISPHGTAIGSQYYHHVPFPINVEAMIEAAGYFVGVHDFTAFMAAGSSVKTTVREIFESKCEWQEPFLHFTIKGNGFLYNMVRIIAGTILDAGKNKIKPDYIPGIIASCDRRKAGPTAPAKGLCLEEVYYSPH